MSPIPAACRRRRSAALAARADAGLPAYAASLRPVRGKCRRGSKRRPCPGRWAVVRVSLDFRPDAIDRLAVLVCAACGKVWRRVRVPTLRNADGSQAVRLDVILPSEARRWRSHGAWHRTGDDGVVLRDANLGDVDEAARAHRERTGRKLAAAAARKARAAEAEAELAARLRETIAAADARRAAREAEDREAAQREAAMA